MKHIVKTLALFAACTAVASCGPKGAGDIPVVDVTKSYPQKTIALQDVAEVEYVPLETREGFLVGYLDVSHMDDEVVVTHNNNGDIMTFDRKTGKALTSFNRKGRGPGEYTGIHTIAVDSEGGEMFVTPNSLSSGDGYPIYVYDMAGKHMRTLSKEIRFPRYLYNYDSDNLFCYNSDTSIPEPYLLLSKTDTLVTTLPVSFTGRENMTVEREFEGGITMMSSGRPLAKDDPGLMLSEPGTDTIFHWTGRELIPVMAQTPSFGSMAYPVGLFFLAQSGDYMFLQTIERKYDWDANSGFKTVNLIYDKASGEFFEGGLANTDYADERMFPLFNSPTAGTFVWSIQPFELVDLHKEGKLRGRLVEIAPTLKEDDNPVMMIVKFK